MFLSKSDPKVPSSILLPLTMEKVLTSTSREKASEFPTSTTGLNRTTGQYSSKQPRAPVAALISKYLCLIICNLKKRRSQQ